MGGPEIIVDQQRYFIELQRQVKALYDAPQITGGSEKRRLPENCRRAEKKSPVSRVTFQGRYSAHVQKKFYRELGGSTLP